MCPSFRATREEMHSTRGRARLLFEMLRGDVIGHDGWRDEAVKQSLDLCLACKGCKQDCPVRADVATYKAEFLHHYYRGRPRPLTHYALGLIYWEARLASRAPRLANTLASAGKSLIGIAPERTLPAFAPQTFRKWFAGRGSPRADGERVILWPDTFVNFFEPHVGIAAVEVLEDAGCKVELPRRTLCCGRPLYDFGLLPMAKRLLGQILEALRAEIRAGVPVVGLEPSCVAVFRDELGNLFPDDNDAKRLAAQTFTLAEWLQLLDWRPPRLERRALVQGHCHHKSIMGLDADTELYERLGVDAELLQSGCCGLAGSFGYEAGDKYDVSMRCAEDVLLPRIRAAGENTLLLADGFSCRHQIEHGTGRTPLHLAEAIQLALREAGAPAPPAALRDGNHRGLIAAGTAAALAATIAALARKK
jgi:Fe-S oxidoreductase